MNYVKSVDALVETLKKCDPQDYVAVASVMEIPPADFMKFAHWNQQGYTRNCIERTEDFELLLLCWNPGDATPIHCHGEQRCWVYQVSGTLKEVIYKAYDQDHKIPDTTKQLKAGEVAYMDDSLGFHSLSNTSDAPSMSLHLYAKPIDACTYYDEELGAFVPSDMRYHSYKGQLINHPKGKAKPALS